MVSDYFLIALRNLARRRLRSWLTMLGIVIGITAVVSLVSIGQGLEAAISSQFGNLGTDKLTVMATGGFGPPGTGVINPLTKDDIEKIKRLNGVDTAIGRLVRAGKLEYHDIAAFGYGASIPSGEGRKLIEETFNLEAWEGRLLKDTDKGKVMLGYGLGQEDSGFKKQIFVGKKVLVQEKEFEVVGILEKEGSFFVDSLVFLNEDEMRKIFGISNDELDTIAIQVKPTANMEIIAEDIKDLMRKQRKVKKGEEDFEVQTPQQVLEQVNSILFAVQVFVYLLAAISVLVGGIGIMNTMFTSVLERTKEIGIMKAIGAKNRAVFLLFFFESGLLGSVGGIIGAIIGTSIAVGGASAARAILGLDLIQANVQPMVIFGAIMGSFLLGSMFGIIPAYKASKLNPVDAMRTK